MAAIDLAASWSAAHAAYCALPDAGELAAIEAAYGEPGRHYHTLVHIRHCLDSIAAEPSFASVEDVEAVRLAVFFHDLVYDVMSKTNEADSAGRWRDYAPGAGFDARVTALVSDLILATEAHKVTPASPAPFRVINDVDMAILAAPPEVYAGYARKVWLEYARFGPEMYRLGRLAFLRGLDAEAVFASEAYRGKAADVARNVAWEIETLETAPETVLATP